jgi:cell division protein FtsA
VPEGLKKTTNGEELEELEAVSDESIRKRKSLNGFWGKFKDGIIDLFKEEDKAF